MQAPKPKIYVFGWPSFLGGADTKLAHLLVLLHRHYEITVVPNHAARLQEEVWTRFLDKLRIKYTTFRRLPRKLEGFGLSLCNRWFFMRRIAHRAKARGLKIIWSSEMMWHHEGEVAAVKAGVVDKVLYVSEFQKRHLAKGYGELPSVIAGNYIDPQFFPFKERQNKTFTIGRLSRHDPAKYPEDFPVFYECLALPDTRFRVMAWSTALERKYRWHRFDDRWDLLPPEKEPQLRFLHSLDLFVYPLGHTFKESWGRSTVEAMLTGCVPLVPAGHHFENLIVSGESGFICQDFLEYQEHAQRLFVDYAYRRRLSAQCRAHALTKLCDPQEHLKTWKEVFS
ncbi:MAG: glycosyltransferase family 4 protein [Verrucomicrobia bacterium]|nr:glycosyltransferase family 4 protein [Verrucomicrobiota bacterium]